MSNIKPNAIYKGVQYIDFEYLKSNNIKGIALDIDNTLIDMSKVLSKDIISWVQKAKEFGFKVCILSNSNKIESKIKPIANKLQIEYIAFAKKPAKSGYLRAAKLLNLECSQIVMIGDQLFTDVIGANRVGMHTIYVEPINKHEYWYTAWKRPIEAVFLRHYGYIEKG